MKRAFVLIYAASVACMILLLACGKPPEPTSEEIRADLIMSLHKPGEEQHAIYKSYHTTEPSLNRENTVPSDIEALYGDLKIVSKTAAGDSIIFKINIPLKIGSRDAYEGELSYEARQGKYVLTEININRTSM